MRKALNLAVDRKKIVETLFLGKATLFGVNHFWPGLPGHDPAWKPYPYDPEQAKQLLVEAGYPKGFEVEMILLKHTGRPEAPQLGEAVAMYWEDIGLKVKRTPMDFATLRPVMYKRKNKRFWVYGMPWYDHPIIAVQRQGISDARFFTASEVKEITDLANKAFEELDPDKRNELTRKTGQMFYDGYYTVPLCGKGSVYAVSDRVKDWPVIPGVGYPSQELQFVTLKR